MAGTKEYHFHPNVLLRLLTNYTDGEVPMAAEAVDVLMNPNLGRVVGIIALSPEWQSQDQLHIRYDGKRIATWGQRNGQGQMEWGERAETPKLQ